MRDNMLTAHGGIVRGDRVLVVPPFLGQSLGKALAYEYGDWAVEFDEPLSSENYSYTICARTADGLARHSAWIARERVSKITVPILGDDDEDCV